MEQAELDAQTARKTAAQLSEQLEGTNRESGTVLESLDRAELTIESLRDQLESNLVLEQQMESRDRQLNSLTGQLAQQQAAFERQESDLARLVEKLSAQVQSLTSENHSLGEDLQEACNNASDASASLSDHERQIRTLNSDLDDQKVQLAEQVARRTRQSTELSKIADQRQKAQSELSQLNSLTSQLAQQLSTAKRKESDVAERLEKLSAQVQTLKSENHSLREDLHEAVSGASDATDSLTDRDQRIRALQTELEDQKSQRAVEMDRHASQLSNLNEFAEKNRQVLSQYSRLKSDFHRQETLFDSERDALRTSHEQELQTQLRSSDSSLTSVRIELGHYQRQVSELKQQVSELKQQVSELAQKNSELERLVQEFEQNQGLAETRLTEARNNKAESENAVAALNDQLSSLRREVDEQKLARSQERSKFVQELQAVEQAHTISQLELKRKLENDRERFKNVKSRHQTPKAKRRVTSASNAKKGNGELTLISGIGPVAAKTLRKHGVKTIDQIAAWTREDVQSFGETLAVGGRIKKEKWVKQAKKLIR